MSRASHRVPSLAVGILALAGCGEGNGILTVTLTLPAAEDGATEARVHAGGGGADPSDALLTAPLAGTPSTFAVEVVAGEDELRRPLTVTAWLCGDGACARPDGGSDGGERPDGGTADGGDGSVQRDRAVAFEFERAFYLGQRTSFAGDVPRPRDLDAAGGALRITVPRCAVEGCRSGTATSWCRLDGSHFCE